MFFVLFYWHIPLNVGQAYRFTNKSTKAASYCKPEYSLHSVCQERHIFVKETFHSFSFPLCHSWPCIFICLDIPGIWRSGQKAFEKDNVLNDPIVPCPESKHAWLWSYVEIASQLFGQLELSYPHFQPKQWTREAANVFIKSHDSCNNAPQTRSRCN